MMKKKTLSTLFLFLCGLLSIGLLRDLHAQEVQHVEPPHEIFHSWKVAELLPGGRFDAVAYLGNQTILVGSRGASPGRVYASYDEGKNWSEPVQITDDPITCIVSGGEGLVYLLTTNSNFFRSRDYGKSWDYLGRISSQESEKGYALSYGVHVTDHGTLLVSDTAGHIYRSVDEGESWESAQQLSERGLYRFERTGNSTIVNGWAGDVFRTQDDGRTWSRLADVTETPLYATEYLGRHVTLQASEGGKIFRSGNYGQTWTELDEQIEAADDFVKLGNGAVLLSTYRDGKNMYVSFDNAYTWENIGPVRTGVEEDWLDHAIYIDKVDEVIVIGVTNQGFVIRATVLRKDLIALGTYQHTLSDEPGNQFMERLRGEIIDFEEINEPEDVLLHEGFAYLPNRDGNSIAVIDISNSDHPALVASIRTPEMLDMFGAHAEGDYLYAVSMSNQKLVAFDISDPYHPEFISSIELGGEGDYGSAESTHIRSRHSHTRLRKVHVRDGYAYVTHNNEGRLYIVDVRDPYRPEVTGHIDTGDGAFAVIVEEDVAYVAGCFPGSSVLAIDVSDKQRPQTLRAIQDDENMRCTCDFQIVDNRLYATGWSDNTLLIFNIDNPEEMTVETIYRHKYIKGPGRLIVRDSRAYIINTTNSSMTVINVENPLAPQFEYFVSDLKMQTVYGIGVDDHFIYLAGRDAKSFLVLEK